MHKSFLTDRGGIEIKPVDVEVWVRANSVRIWNEFKNLGIIRRAEFVQAIQAHDGKYDGSEGTAILNRYWQGRYFSQSLNEDLEQILETIKNIKGI
jgi:hypothetical protein